VYHHRYLQSHYQNGHSDSTFDHKNHVFFSIAQTALSLRFLLDFFRKDILAYGLAVGLSVGVCVSSIKEMAATVFEK